MIKLLHGQKSKELPIFIFLFVILTMLCDERFDRVKTAVLSIEDQTAELFA